jgi:pimeloyl-ACP methyl ester carboxylesterase
MVTKSAEHTSLLRVIPDTLRLFDQSRSRDIPIAIYMPKVKHPQVILISHGYNQNEGTPYLGYSDLANFLASKGYFVVSIQHECPADSLVPEKGIPQIVRRPFWERGADNIMFIIKELKKSNPDLDFAHITLIGHSMGGDMAALFPQRYPDIAWKIITFDNRRMALPRTINPRVYSLRSSDQQADPGVLPTDAEQRKYGIIIIKLANTIHNDMCDNANEKQRKEIREYVLAFLKK